MGSHHILKSQSNSHQFTTSFHTNSFRKPPHDSSETQKKLTCVYCKGFHTPGNCEVAKDQQKRLGIIKRDRLCINCLGHHRMSHCNSKYRCRNCGHKHRTSICSEARTGNGAQLQQSSQPATSKTASLTTLTPPSLGMSRFCQQNF